MHERIDGIPYHHEIVSQVASQVSYHSQRSTGVYPIELLYRLTVQTPYKCSHIGTKCSHQSYDRRLPLLSLSVSKCSHDVLSKCSKDVYKCSHGRLSRFQTSNTIAPTSPLQVYQSSCSGGQVSKCSHPVVDSRRLTLTSPSLGVSKCSHVSVYKCSHEPFVSTSNTIAPSSSVKQCLSVVNRLNLSVSIHVSKCSHHVVDSRRLTRQTPPDLFRCI